MTGPLGPMDDDGVVDLLRAAGRGGRDASPADVTRAMAAGTKIRRRRQAMQVVGSGLAIVAVLGVGITTVATLDDGENGTPVTSSPDVVAPAVRSNEALAAGYLAEDLGTGWVNNAGTVTLDPDSDLASQLPDGGYTATAKAELIDKAAFDQVCRQRDKLTCEEVQTSDGNTIYLWDWADRDLASGEIRGEASAYRPIGDGKYVLIVIAVDGPSVTVAQREAHIDTVSAWFATMEGGLRKAVTDSRIKNSLTIEPSLAQSVLDRHANTQLLLETLGPDFRANNEKTEGPGASLIVGSPSAAGLPEGYKAVAEVQVGTQENGTPTDRTRCTALAEKDMQRSSCEDVSTPGGQTVQFQTTRIESEAREGSGAFNLIEAYFVRTDATVVDVTMTVSDETDPSNDSRQDAAMSWLEKYADEITALAADPRVLPKAGATSGQENISNEQRLAEHLGDAFMVRNEEVVLPKRSEIEPAMPSDLYSATADIQVVSQAQFDAVCKKAGATPCTKRGAPGDLQVYVWDYTDRNDTDGVIRGERAVYFVREDGQIVLASLSLVGPGDEERVTAARFWLENFESGLTAAATDARMRFAE